MSSSRRSKLGNASPVKFRKFRIRVIPCFILKVGEFVWIPGYEPVQLDLEKLLSLSVSKEIIDSKRTIRTNLPYKIIKKVFGHNSAP